MIGYLTRRYYALKAQEYFRECYAPAMMTYDATNPEPGHVPFHDSHRPELIRDWKLHRLIKAQRPVSVLMMGADARVTVVADAMNKYCPEGRVTVYEPDAAKAHAYQRTVPVKLMPFLAVRTQPVEDASGYELRLA